MALESFHDAKLFIEECRHTQKQVFTQHHHFHEYSSIQREDENSHYVGGQEVVASMTISANAKRHNTY